MNWFRFLVALFTIGVLAACSQTPVAGTSESDDSIEREIIKQITVEPETSGIGGNIKTAKTNGAPLPLADTPVRLAKVFWNEDHSEGAFVIEGGHSPSTISSENGVFTFVNIAPGDYVIVVGDVLGVHEVVADAGGKAKIFSAEVGKVNDVGEIIVSIP